MTRLDGFANVAKIRGIPCRAERQKNTGQKALLSDKAEENTGRSGGGFGAEYAAEAWAGELDADNFLALK